MQKTYSIEVDCANCANLMEEKIKSMDGVNDATVNFMTQKLKLCFNDNYNEKNLLKSIAKACKKIDSDFEIEL